MLATLFNINSKETNDQSALTTKEHFSAQRIELEAQ